MQKVNTTGKAQDGLGVAGAKSAADDCPPSRVLLGNGDLHGHTPPVVLRAIAVRVLPNRDQKAPLLHKGGWGTPTWGRANIVLPFHNLPAGDIGGRGLANEAHNILGYARAHPNQPDARIDCLAGDVLPGEDSPNGSLLWGGAHIVAGSRFPPASPGLPDMVCQVFPNLPLICLYSLDSNRA